MELVVLFFTKHENTCSQDKIDIKLVTQYLAMSRLCRTWVFHSYY